MLPGGFELDDDAERIDRAEVHRFLSTDSYWARGRDRETQDALIAGATRVVGLYHEGRQVGFCRAFSDGVTLAYLADVYVLPELRGRGLGMELVGEMVDRGPLAHVKWLLHTADAHGLYAKFGFGPLNDRALERPRPEH
jgi:GNAT superfamily N-acetyltransferase